MNNHVINGLIISAGKSGRMGNFKPLMNYNGKTFLQNIISNLNAVCSEIIIVTGYNSEDLTDNTINAIKKDDQLLYKKLVFVENKDYEKGMFTSLQKGVAKAKNSEWILYHFVDQPGLPSEFYTDFAGQIDNFHNWIQPSYDKLSGHPILLKNDLFDIILNGDKDSNLRDINKMPVVKRKKWECYYKNVLQDIDTQEDYLSSINPFL